MDHFEVHRMVLSRVVDSKVLRARMAIQLGVFFSDERVKSSDALKKCFILT